MYLASRRIFPSTPVLLTLSEPAKSTKCSFERRMTVEECDLDVMEIMKMQCDRVEVGLDGVSAIIRLVSPMKSKFRASSSVIAGTTDKFRK